MSIAPLSSLSDAQVQFAEAQRTKTILSGMSHELFQPLTAAANYIYAALRTIETQGDTIPNQALSFLEKSTEQIERANSIAKGFRDPIALPPIAPAQEDLNSLTISAIESLCASRPEDKVELKLDLDPSLPRLSLDSLQFTYAVNELTKNALEAMAMSGTGLLVITTRNIDDNEIEVSLTDNGPGVPDALSERLFDAFVTSKTSGSGIGLTASRRIIESMFGRLWFTPAYPHGATFHIALPLSKER